MLVFFYVCGMKILAIRGPYHWFCMIKLLQLQEMFENCSLSSLKVDFWSVMVSFGSFGRTWEHLSSGRRNFFLCEDGVWAFKHVVSHLSGSVKTTCDLFFQVWRTLTRTSWGPSPQTPTKPTCTTSTTSSSCWTSWTTSPSTCATASRVQVSSTNWRHWDKNRANFAFWQLTSCYLEFTSCRKKV